MHRWAEAVVRTGERQRQSQDDVPDAELPDWYAACADALLTQLSVDPASPTWTFTGAGTVAFWRRRQALEAAVHRVDAERSAGCEHPVPDDLAEDGVAEVVEVLHPRQVQLGRTEEPACSAQLVSTSGRRWLLGHGPTCATVSGPASDLLLLLWRRRVRSEEVFTVEGDLAALDALLSHRLTP